MSVGTKLLENYIPELDATVVSRILDAGGTILGKATCENLCMSGESFSADTGPVLNPYDITRSSGGSSSGCGALLALGEADMAVAGDQGGSIRIPSARCGVYGLKPTYGLVPCTGSFYSEMTLDHIGPMARSAADVALMLEVIAGPDELDPRQPSIPSTNYTEALAGGVSGLHIGVVDEGFGWPGISEPDVDHAVRDAASAFERLGCTVTDISVPWHRDGTHIFRPIALEGGVANGIRGNGMGDNWKGHYVVSLIEAFGRATANRTSQLPVTVKIAMLTAEYMRRHYQGRHYAEAQNARRLLTKAYDAALRSFDALLMPTVPYQAIRIPTSPSPDEYMTLAVGMDLNTCPFNLTGHPAMSVPCAMSNGLPVGMMLIARHGNDATLLRLADVFQRRVFSPPRPTRA